MKKLRLFLSSLLLSGGFVSAQELIVPAGSNYRISADQQELTLERLQIGDNARIEFAPGVERWFVEALQAQIGSNVVIDARGGAGRDGGNGDNFDQVKPNDCSDGKPGIDGGTGENGAAGVDVRLRLGLNSIGSIVVDTSGGTGGRGGSGGNGQHLSQENCENSDGGNGGSGGNGGAGADAGNVRVSLWPGPAANIDINKAIEKFSLTADGGLGGEGGVGGSAGKGSPGKYINKKSLAGNRTWVAGGDDGTGGRNGVNGKSGRSGLIDIEEDTLMARQLQPSPAPITDVSIQQSRSTVAAGTDTVQQLRQELEAVNVKVRELQQRLQALEAQQD